MRPIIRYYNLNRLTSTDRDAQEHQAWELDALGNSNSVTTDSVREDRTHNAQNQLTEIGSATLGFDANGNTSTDHLGRTLIYDAWNRLVEAKSGQTSLIRYEYDAATRRTEEAPADSPARRLYYSDKWQVIEERLSTTNYQQATINYVWSPVYVDAAIARDRDTDANGSPDERIYLMQDGNYNVTAAADASGTVVERYQYDAYGKRTVLTTNHRPTTTNYAQRQGFQGGFYDAVLTSQINFRNRITDVEMMRWLQQDSARYADTMSLYEGVGTNPISYVDPEGLTGRKSKPNVKAGNDLGGPRDPNALPTTGQEKGVVIQSDLGKLLNTVWRLKYNSYVNDVQKRWPKIDTYPSGVTPAQLGEILRDTNVVEIVFIGHGANTDGLGIIWLDDKNAIFAQDVKRIIGKSRTIKRVTLRSCWQGGSKAAKDWIEAFGIDYGGFSARAGNDTWWKSDPDPVRRPVGFNPTGSRSTLEENPWQTWEPGAGGRD